MKIVAGIYRITCVPTQDTYVGQSWNLRNRMREHQLQFCKKHHQNKRIQSLLLLHGAESFVCECLEICPEEDRQLAEHWLNTKEREYGLSATLNICAFCRPRPLPIQRPPVMIQECCEKRADSFPDRLKSLIESRGWSVANFAAELAAGAGVSRQYVYSLLRGAKQPSWDVVVELADALGVSTDAFRRA